MQATEGYTEGKVRYTKDVYRNSNPAYQPRYNSYQDAQPYRPPGYQAPYQAPRSDFDKLKKLIVDLHKHSDQRMDHFQ